MWDTDADVIRVHRLARTRGVHLRKVLVGAGDTYTLADAETLKPLDAEGTRYTLFEAEERLRALPGVEP